MSDIWVVKNKITGRYYQYIGKGVERWVKSPNAACLFTTQQVSDMLDDLNCQGMDVIGQRIEIEKESTS